MQEIIIQPSSQPTKVTIKDPEVIVSTTDVPNVPPTLTATASSPTLPDGKILLNATANDADGSIKRILWSTTNPKAVISDPAKEDTFATVSSAGTYVFRIEIEDDKGYIVFMTVTSIVAAAPNTLPVVNAGQDLTIIAPASTAQLNGSGSDAEGGVSFMWSKVSGSGTIVNPNQAVASVTGLTVGVSVFRLTVTDSSGVTRTDDVNITVQSSTVPGQTTNLSFTPLTTDYTRPFGGFEAWLPNGSGWDVSIPNVSRLDDYDRFGWGQLDLSFSALESRIKTVIDRGGKFGFGVMTYLPGAVIGWKEAIRWSDGSAGLYPQSVHDAMQASSNQKDTKTGSTWCPNWNHESYLKGWEDFHVKLYNWLNTTSYKGVKYKDAINYYEVRGYGRYGEWNMWNDSKPKATEASLLRIINAVKNAIPDIWLLTLTDGYVQQDNDCTPAVSYLLLTGRNAKGKFGARKDHMGSQYFPNEDDKYNGNSTVVNGQKLGDIFRDGWKESPYVGEPALGNSNGYSYIDDDAVKYHFSVIGNGNYGGVTASNVVACNKAMGYRTGLSSGTLTTNTGALSVTLQWINNGNAPVYEDFDVLFELRQGSTVVRTFKSQFSPKLFMGQKSFTDNFNGIPSGTYDLYLKVINPSKYRTLPLNVTGKLNDGSYLLKSNVVL